MSITGISITFSFSIWTYVFVLISEGVSTKWRPRATMIPFVLFVLGFMSLSGISYLVRHASWRVVYLCTSVPAAVYCIFLYLFAIESPRWLHLQGKNEEAIEVLKKISPAKKGYLGSVSICLPSEETLEEAQRSALFRPEHFRDDKHCFRSRTRFFFCGRIQFNLMAVYMVELFPTCVRNTTTLMLRQALVVAGACSPIIAYWKRCSITLFRGFGLAMAGFGLFALLLPETKGSSLCDTMEAQEERGRALNTSQSCLK
ncbi:Organic cation/carnitine transporter 5 [Raphanus sativus]|nr:Organic cation/carnitine transporter 5 [Raphanus sativus]